MRFRSSALALLALLLLTGAAGTLSRAPMRLGVVSFYNPRLMYLKYQPLVDFLTQRTGRQWELSLSASYERTVADLCAGRIDLAYLGPFTYVRAHEACGAVPVVRLQTAGKPTFRSSILVRSDSTIANLADLRGRRFGFGAPLSTSSHLIARPMLEAAGLTPGRDIECRYYGHHDRAARAVLLGEVDACAIRDIVAERFIGRGLRIIAESEPIPNFPLVLGPERLWLREDLVRALVLLPRVDPAVREQISRWDLELAGGFDLVSDDEFEGIRELAVRVFGRAALSMSEERMRCQGAGGGGS